MSSLVPAHLLDAPLQWRPGPVLDYSSIISSSITGPILPLPTLQKPVRLNKDGQPVRSGKRQRPGGLITSEAAIEDGKRKEKEKKDKAIEKKAKAAAREEAKVEKQKEIEEKKAKKIQHVEERKIKKRIDEQKKLRKKVMKLLDKWAELRSQAAPTVRTKQKTLKKLLDERQQGIDTAHVNYLVASRQHEQLLKNYEKDEKDEKDEKEDEKEDEKDEEKGDAKDASDVAEDEPSETENEDEDGGDDGDEDEREEVIRTRQGRKRRVIADDDD